jgi:hypothetical protein
LRLRFAHSLMPCQNHTVLRRRYGQLRSPKSWLEHKPKAPTFKVPRNTPAREALLLEQQHAAGVSGMRKQWERCVRFCMQVL